MPEKLTKIGSICSSYSRAEESSRVNLYILAEDPFVWAAVEGETPSRTGVLVNSIEQAWSDRKWDLQLEKR